MLLIAIYVSLLALASWVGILPLWLIAWVVIMSLVTFAVYAADKYAAIHGAWRTQERSLHLLALFGGWPGARIAHRLLRHKSAKQRFQRVFWVTVMLNLLLMAGLVSAPARPIFDVLSHALFSR